MKQTVHHSMWRRLFPWLPASRTPESTVVERIRRRKLALILPAHDEELIIQTTILSAKRGGLSLHDIYVVDDASTDDTLTRAREVLPQSNVLSVEHSGKAGAVLKAINAFRITERYEWVHIADADSIFDKDYFRIYRRNLSPKYVAAVGFVQSLKGNWLCTYRCFSYTYGQHLFRRLQSWLGMILVMPGPVTSYRTDIIRHLNFSTGSLTEDFDITVQIHRQRLGKIKYIPDAVNYTQDPRGLHDFYKQTLRWYRGWFQGVMRYRLGFGMQLIDVNFFFQIFEIISLGIIIGTAVTLMLHTNILHSGLFKVMLTDLAITGALAVFVAMLTKRLRIIFVLPVVFLLRFVELCIYIQAFVEIVILRKFENRKEVGWQVAGRRYALATEALEDL